MARASRRGPCARRCWPNLEEPQHEVRWLLQIGGHHREIRPAGFDEAGADRGERTEVARHLEHARDERHARKHLDEPVQRAVGTAIDDEDHFEFPANAAPELHQFSQ